MNDKDENWIAPRVQQLVEQVRSMTDELLNELLVKWKAMFVIDEKLLDKNFNQFLKYVEEFHSDILESAQTKQAHYIEEVESKLKERTNLQRELKMTIKESFETHDPLTLILESLENSLKDFRELKEHRMKQLNDYMQQEKELSELLSETPLNYEEGVPSEETLHAIHHHIIKLQEEKASRQNLFCNLKENIVEMLNKLEIEPETAFEREVLSSDQDNFKLIPSNMKKLKEVQSSLLKRVEETTSMVSLLKDKLENLWNRIKIDQEYQQQFISVHCGIGKSDIKAFKDELSRCEEIKLANLKPMIENARLEISDLWDKLTFAEEQRQHFQPYYLDLVSEDILELHELECTKLKQFYQDNKIIFDLADKREILWQRMLQLDDIAQDKTRLFNNRGGQLLKEEKERKMLENNLPKINNQLKKELEAFSEKHCKPFLWYGEDLQRKITESWEERAQMKQSKTLARKNGQVESKTHMALKRKNPATPNSVYRAKDLKKTPSGQILQSHPSTPSIDINNASIASYNTFQEDIESAAYVMTPRKRPARNENVSPIRAHSSPTTKTLATPGSLKKAKYAPSTPKTTPRRLFHPITNSAKKRPPMKL